MNLYRICIAHIYTTQRIDADFSYPYRENIFRMWMQRFLQCVNESMELNKGVVHELFFSWNLQPTKTNIKCIRIADAIYCLN